MTGRLRRFTARTGRRWVRGEDGASTVEFVILFPIFIVLFLSCFESAMLLTRQLMLERALDIVMRDVRLSTGETFPRALLRRAICERARILPSCDANLLVEITPVDRADYALPPATVSCVDRGASVRSLSGITPGGADQLMVVRACFTVDPFFPTIGLGLDLVGDGDETIRIATASAFVQEPDRTTSGGSS